MSVRHFWRRFKPQGFGREIAPRPHTAASVWHQAIAYVEELFPGRKRNDDALTRTIQSVRDRAVAENDPVLLLAALILQAPRAAWAQEQMDHHPHGYHNKHARLYELIDFNDTYVSAVLAMPEDELPTFADEAKRAMDTFCKRLKSRCFSNEQYDAITHGLSREIAVYRGVKKEGLRVEMTSRTQDALGIDMVITDPESGQAVNIDCKTGSAYFYRLKDLVREGRLTDDQAAEAEELGYCRIVNGDEHQRAEIYLWRIDHETYGPIVNFTFDDTSLLGEVIRTIIRDSNR